MTCFGEDGPAFLGWINSVWGIKAIEPRLDFSISGSPQRCHSRVVIGCESDRLFLVEQFSQDQYLHRRKVAQTIFDLARNGLKPVIPYCRAKDGSHLVPRGIFYYGVTPFILSDELARPEYLNSRAIGEQFAGFIIHLSDISGRMNLPKNETPFNITTYIYDLFSRMKKADPRVAEMFQPVLQFLEKRFIPYHDQLPVWFCHGDLHPLNVIWKNNRMAAVIDWEFSGTKPALFDAANLIGCAGIENPEGLAGKMVTTFIKTLSGVFSNDVFGWHLFPEYVLALRFAWLSEWLRNKDVEMIRMEKDYMHILVKNMDVLKAGWNLSGTA